MGVTEKGYREEGGVSESLLTRRERRTREERTTERPGEATPKEGVLT